MFSDPHPDLIRPVRSDQFLPSLSPWISLGGLFLIGTIGAIVTLAALIEYNVTVKAPATVRPLGEVRLVQASREGAIESILVEENMTVKQGEAIALIDDSRLQTQKKQLQSNIEQGQLQILQIAAQINNLNTKYSAEAQLLERTLGSTIAALQLNQRDYQEKQVSTTTTVKELDAALELARTEMQQYQQLANTGSISFLQIEQKEQAFQSALAKLERAKAMLNPSDATVTIAQERIAQEKARGESTLATLNQERDNLLRLQLQIQNQLDRDRQELQQVETEIKDTLIRASVDGIILKLELRNLGQMVRLGETIAQIAPNNTSLVVKAHVTAQDIGKIQLCKTDNISDCQEGKAQLRISAYPYPDYGTLKAAVRKIAPDTLEPESNKTKTTDPYYEVTLEPEKLYLVNAGQKYPLQSGMEVTADMIAKEETILTFLLRKVRLLTDL
jgi:HlyD family type I secretion membrane fusion protein